MIEDYINKQIDAAIAQLDPPPPGWHYSTEWKDIIYNYEANSWECSMEFKLVRDL